MFFRNRKVTYELSEGKSWFEALGYCDFIGGHMIQDIRHEDYLLLNALAQMYVESDKWVSIFWIGGSDIDQEGIWKWTHSGLFFEI